MTLHKLFTAVHKKVPLLLSWQVWQIWTDVNDFRGYIQRRTAWKSYNKTCQLTLSMLLHNFTKFECSAVHLSLFESGAYYCLFKLTACYILILSYIYTLNNLQLMCSEYPLSACTLHALSRVPHLSESYIIKSLLLLFKPWENTTGV